MKPTRPQDALSLVLIAIAVAALAVAHNVHRLSAARALPNLILTHSLIAAAVLLAAAGVIAARVVATRRTLRTRTRLVLLASEDFDPSPEAVVRFAAQLARLRPAVGGWIDPRARALRVLIDTDPAGRLRYAVEVPARSLGLLRTALGNYEQLEAPARVAPRRRAGR